MPANDPGGRGLDVHDRISRFRSWRHDALALLLAAAHLMAAWSWRGQAVCVDTMDSAGRQRRERHQGFRACVVRCQVKRAGVVRGRIVLWLAEVA